jgi:hypothetical protein
MTKYGPIWEIIDLRWNNQLHRPIHAVGYFLNSRYHYRAQLGEDLIREVRDGLYECLERMVPSESEQLESWRYTDISLLSLEPQVPLART